MASRDSLANFIEVGALRVGLYVYLDLGWMRHPFAVNSFKITSQEQIDTIVRLGLNRIRWSPENSDQEIPSSMSDAAHAEGDTPQRIALDRTATTIAAAIADGAQRRRRLLAAQRQALAVCENGFADANRAYRATLEAVPVRPEAARAQAEQAVAHMVGQLLEHDESAIRLLSENAGEKASLHAVNVAALSLLLGKQLGHDPATLVDLGLGALLHDVGKLALPERLRWQDGKIGTGERDLYETHVAHGIAYSRAMHMGDVSLAIVAQHHELADGSGFPGRLDGAAIHPLARIVALVNRYDKLSNAANPAQALTPHETMSLIYARMRGHYDSGVMMPFVRMMGVYPPGSVIELSDGRFALVVSVNARRPLRPQIIIHEPRLSRDEALIVDLEDLPELGIRRSLKPLQLPRAALDYLSPRNRICYFFERARHPDNEGKPVS